MSFNLDLPLKLKVKAQKTETCGMVTSIVLFTDDGVSHGSCALDEPQLQGLRLMLGQILKGKAVNQEMQVGWALMVVNSDIEQKD